ncbi:HK97-gp10 family putative phage morphogenesis protein [Rhizobium mongolense]|uniref:HK97 gp10 family phage protein n=1 Tax=Rhizobium mongolense TaxID=57676 RepID=A0A7W6RHY6_9HYPH|nr:HK97-gp10 family putative phage morphogenesis protein [Rhizobium mongolense]MBB4272787.1 HK97 gp10 family phage protein [Rhizobium mongolense]
MVQGIGALNKAVAAIPKRVELAARAAMEKSADELVAMMKRLVPVEDGDLRASIGWTWGNAPAGAKVLTQTDPDERGLKITVYAGSQKAYYSAFVEFGTAPHNVATGGGNKNFSGTANAHPGSRAQPFFFPSYRSLKKRIQSRIRREMKKAIKFVGPVTQSEAD